MTTLVITEKPSVAMDIGRVLGGFTRQDGFLEKPDMIISWAVGHLVGLAMPQDYDLALERWDLNTLPIIPEAFALKPNPSTIKQLRVLQNLMRRGDVARLINACDAGREGELIFRNIVQFLDCRKPHDRLWLSETTPTAIRNAFANLRTSAEVDNLAQAATSRSQADWIVGINATRGYTAKHREKLTVGRVQTPTLALIVNRDRDIDGFVPQDYWEIEAEFNSEADTYKGKWVRDKRDRFSDRVEAEEIISKLTPSSPAQVISIETKEKTEQPPMLFNLIDLQKEANKKFGFTAEQTLNLTQKLYEAHLVTYPRTDSRYLTEAMSATLPSRLNSLRSTELGTIVCGITGSITSKRYVDDSKVTDHTAIIVTDVLPDLSRLTADESKIYLMVARRMVGMFLPPARIQQTIIVTECLGETFESKGKVILDLGWKQLYAGDKEEDDTPTLPVLTEGQQVTLQGSQVLDKQTQPPKRYNEATLLGAMENAGRNIEDEALRDVMQGKGLGTPATRAAMIEKLISTGYIARQKKALISTDKGKTLIGLVAPKLKDPELTGNWEKKLLDIEQGRYNSSLYMQEIRQFAQEIITDIKAQGCSTAFATANSLGECPLCSKAVVENRKGYGCSGWKDGCRFVVWKKIADKTITKEQAKKLLTNGKTGLIKGFKSKKGSTFDAYLKLDGPNIIFEFPPKATKK